MMVQRSVPPLRRNFCRYWQKTLGEQKLSTYRSAAGPGPGPRAWDNTLREGLISAFEGSLASIREISISAGGLGTGLLLYWV